MFWHQLRNELIKLFGKKRTYIGFAMFLLAQNVIALVFRFTRASRGMERALENNGYLAEHPLRPDGGDGHADRSPTCCCRSM